MHLQPASAHSTVCVFAVVCVCFCCCLCVCFETLVAAAPSPSPMTSGGPLPPLERSDEPTCECAHASSECRDTAAALTLTCASCALWMPVVRCPSALVVALLCALELALVASSFLLPSTLRQSSGKVSPMHFLKWPSVWVSPRGHLTAVFCVFLVIPCISGLRRVANRLGARAERGGAAAAASERILLQPSGAARAPMQRPAWKLQGSKETHIPLWNTHSHPRRTLSPRMPSPPPWRSGIRPRIFPAARISTRGGSGTAEPFFWMGNIISQLVPSFARSSHPFCAPPTCAAMAYSPRDASNSPHDASLFSESPGLKF
jgi:hypothetical protein